jgi:GAF domain-containing protein
MIFATLMFSAQAGFITLGISMATFAVVGFLAGSGSIQLLHPQAINAPFTDWLSTSVTTALFGVCFILGLRQLQKEFVLAQERTAEAMHALEKERASLEDRVDARTLQLTAVNQVGRVASSILDPEELAGRVANLITDHFGYYYAALFLVDEAGQQAWLYSATGEAGRVLKENKHHLQVGGKSMVGMAISTGKARVALDVGTESVRFQNPLLPYTRSEIALPLAVGGRVLGALDVQSTKAGAFGPQEIATLENMAGQVAVALENARLFRDAQKSLEEMETIQRQYVADSWRPLAAAQRLDYRLGESEPGNSESRIEVPLALREQVIGKIELASDAEWTPEQKNLIETVASQAALALENARLVEESQSVAQREHQLAEMTSRIWTATSIDGILQTAIRELGQALELNEATIELKMDAGHE